MAFPKFLMLLPLLRQLNEVNNKALVNAQRMYKPELSPLLQETLPKPASAGSNVKENEDEGSNSETPTTAKDTNCSGINTFQMSQQAEQMSSDSRNNHSTDTTIP